MIHQPETCITRVDLMLETVANPVLIATEVGPAE